MNRIYRLVFNRELGVVQVASELTSSSHGGAGSAEGVRTALLPALRFAIYVALGFVTTLPAFAQAVQGEGRIVSDRSSGANRPTVLDAGNGVPVINIATPSAQGVSRNIYGQFDVGSQGAILNNARSGADSQLAGSVAGNPYLARGEARVILNEVNGPTSQLNGYIEVAGRRAEVIIANPAGITCAGCGFINASNATLTTGKPVFVGGNLDHYRVEGGTVRIEGAGLDATATDYTRILARAMEVNGGVWANDVDVRLGANTVNATDPGQTTPIAGQGGVPQFALDVGALGGMYANKIFLVSNERGLGARNAGTLGAQAGDLIVTVDGRLENVSRAAFQSKRNAQVTASGGVVNAGTITAARELVVTTPADVDNSGGQINARRVEVNAQSLSNRSGAIEQTGLQALALNAGTLTNRDGGRIGVAVPVAGGGESGGSTGGSDSVGGGTTGGGGGGTGGGALPELTPLADGALNVAGHLANDGGKINAGGEVALSSANGLDNSGGQLGLRSLTMTQGDLTNAGGTLDITGAATLHTASIDNTAGALNVGGALDAHTQTFHNAGGTLNHSGPTATVQVDATLDNAMGTIASNAAALSLAAGVLVNEDGLIEHAGAGGLQLQAGTVYGAGGTITTAGAATLRAGQVDHRAASLGAAQLTLAADGFDNRGGRIVTTGAGANTLSVRGTFDNGNNGVIESNGDLTISAGTFDNADGTVRQAGPGTLAIGATTLSGSGGALASNGALTIAGTTTDLRGGTTSAQSVAVDTGTLITAGGTLTATGAEALSLRARDSLDNSAGRIATNGVLAIDAGALVNAEGTISAAGTQASRVAVAGTLDNARGVLAAAGALDVQAGTLINRDTADIDGAGLQAHALTVHADHVDNTAGRIGANASVTVAAETLDNAAGSVTAANGLTVAAARLNGAGGTLGTNGALTLTGEAMDLRGGTTFADSVRIDSGALTTAGGSLIATGMGPLAIVARDAVDNTAGTITSNGSVQLRVGTLVNVDGTLTAVGEDASTVAVASTLDNTRGTLSSNGAVDLAAGTLINRDTAGIDGAGLRARSLTVRADRIDNASGQIGANDTVAVTAAALDNTAGSITAANALAVDATTLNGAGGTLGSNGALSVTGDVTNLRGGNTFGDTVRIDTGTLTTAGGSLLATGTQALAITARDGLENTAGTIASNGVLDIEAGALVNADGTISASGVGDSQLDVTGKLDNSAGLIATTGALSLAANQLTNRDTKANGAAPKGVWAQRLEVQAARVDNANGALGANDTAVVMADMLGNTGGAITGANALTIDAATLSGAGGTLGSNGAVRLTGQTTDLRGGTTSAQSIVVDTGDLITAGGTLSASGTDPLSVTARGLWDNAGGTMVGNGALQADVGTLTNTDGVLQAAGTGATDVRVAGRFDNTRGALGTAGATTVHAGEFLNVGGAVQSASEHTLTITADGSLINDGGTLAGNGAIDLSAQSMSNADGVVQTQRSIAANVADTLDNHSGTFASGDVLTVTTNTLINRDTFDPTATDPAQQKGLLGRQIAVDVGALDNTRGQIQSSTVLTLTGTDLVNAGGSMAGGEAVTVSGLRLDNTGGTLIQRGDAGALTLTIAQGLNNTGAGLIGAEGTANVHAGARLDNSGGTVFARHGLTVGGDADVLNRDGGLLQSNGDLTVGAGGSFDNTDGVFDATGHGVLTAAVRIDNTRGQVLAGGTTAVPALTAGTSTLINQGGMLGSRNGDVVITAETVDNRAEGLLVAKRDLTLHTASLNNADGTVYAGNDLRYVNAGGSLDNTGGKFGSGATTWLNLAGLVNAGNGKIDAGTLWLTLPVLDTTGGEISADVLNTNIGALIGSGRLFGRQGLSLAFNGDFTYANGLRLESDGTLSLTVAGTFLNQGTWQTASVLNITADNVVNEGTLNASNASGTGETHVTASGTIDNRTGATIEGDSVALSAANVTNTGDIVGDRITIEADTLTNGRDLGAGQPVRAYGEGFIGASQTLDLRIGQSLRNLDAEIFSLGDLSITGRGGVGTRAGSVDNLSGRIQAEGDLLLATNALRNERRVLDFVQRPLTPAEQAALTLETFGEDALTYDEGWSELKERYCADTSSQRCVHFRVDDYAERVTPTEGLFVNTATPAAQLLSGGDMALEASSVRNRFATIASRQNLTINGQAQAGSSGEGAAGVSNESVSGQQTYTATAEYNVGYQTCPRRAEVDCQYEDYGGRGTLNFGTVTRTYSPEEGRATISAGQGLTITTDGDVNNTVVSAADPRSGITIANQTGPGSTGLGGATGVSQSGVGGVDATSGTQFAGASGPGVRNGTRVKTSGALQLALTDYVNGSDNPANAAAQVIGTPERPLPGLVPPDNGMYDTSGDPNAPFLVTTAPRFASKGNWTSSNYLLGLLGAQDTHKRLGDGYYEQQLVMDQILQLTGRRNLGGGLDGLAQYQRLMDGAAAEAARLGLGLGAPLTSTQIASLSQDIAWLVEMEVDGQRVLVPVVYLSSATAERLRADGALLAGDTVDLQSGTQVNNDGTIAGNRGTWLSADRLINHGAIRADQGRLDIATRGDTTNFGRLSGHSVVIDAGGSVVNQPTFDGLAWRGGAIEAGPGGLQMVAALDVTNRGKIASAGNAGISAGRDAIQAAQLSSAGNMGISAGGDARFAGKSTTGAGGYLFIEAGRHVVGETATDTQAGTSTVSVRGGTSRVTVRDETVTGATFKSGDQLAMVSHGGNVDLTAATVRSEHGGVALVAEQGDVNLRAAEEEHHRVEDTYRKKKGTFSSTTTRTHLEVDDTVSVGTTVSGKTVDVLANNILVHGSTAVSDDATNLMARNNVAIVAAQNTHEESYSSSKKKSGMFSDGGVGFTVGTSKVQQTADVKEVTHTGSVIGAVDGQVNIYAGNHYQQTGSDVIGLDGVAISGKTVAIEHAVDTLDVHETQKAKSGGLHVSIKGGAADAAAQAYGSMRRSGEVEDDRLKGLYAAQAAQTLFSPAAGGPQAFGDAADMMQNGGPSVENNGGMSLRIGIGASSSKAESDTHQTTAHGSTVSSRGTTTIVAREGGLAVVGSTVEGVNTALAAADKLILLSAEEGNELRQKNSAKSGEIGVTFGSEAGIGVYVSASAAKGKGQGSGTAHTETIIRGGESTTFVSGGDTIGRGAQIIGDKVIGRVGGDLLLSSEQDTNDYKRKDAAAGIDAAVGMGGGQVSGYASQSKVNSNYTSVEKQTGIQAGKGGYDIDVQGHTQLDAAAIASTADPSRNTFSTGSLGWSDLKNEAEYKATSISVSGGGGTSGGSFSGGISATHDQSSSTTQAGIADGTLLVRDGSGGDIARGVPELQQSGLKEIYDAQKVAETMELQQVAGQVGFTAAKDVISYKRDAAQQELNAAAKDYENATTDEQRAAAVARKDAAKASMDRWSDGGSAKVGTQVLAGVFQASLGGTDLVGAASGVAANEYLLTAISNKANNAGLDADGTGHEVGMSLAAIAVGWAAGAATGNGTAGAIAGNSAQQYGYYDYRDGRAQTVASQEGMLQEMANGDPATFEAMKYLLNEAMKKGADPADLAMSLSAPGVAANLVGMAVVESTAQGLYGKNFNALSEADKRAVLERAGSARVNVGPSETVDVDGVAAQPGAVTASQPAAQSQEESFQTKAGRAVSGVIEEGGRGVEKAKNWIGEDNATALALVAMTALGGPVKTLGSALWENSAAGQAMQAYKQEYLVNPLSGVIGTYGLGAETDAQRQAVKPASDTMANMGADALLSSFGAISAGKGAKNIVEGSEGFGKKIDNANEGVANQEVLGGPHSQTSQPRNDGMDSHHCPAQKCYSGAPISSMDGPAIKMDPADHAKTASNGNGRIAQEYRRQQQELLGQGRLMDAIQMDIDDIRSKFGNKYDDHIKQLLDYARTLDPNEFRKGR